MARPRLPDNQLKNKRRIRKGTSTSLRLDVPKPTAAQRKLWQGILDAAIISVLSNSERNDNINKKVKMDIFFPTGTMPKDFPIRSYTERTDKGDLITINAELVLCWLYSHHYTDHTPNSLYKSRTGCIGLLTKAENMLDIEFGDVLE